MQTADVRLREVSGWWGVEWPSDSFTCEEFELWQTYFRFVNGNKVLKKPGVGQSVNCRICVKELDYSGK